MGEPILVMGFPRSGTSLIAGIVSRHGVFTGTVNPPDARNPTGYYSNLFIKNLLVREYGHGTDFILDKRDVRRRIEAGLVYDGYESGPWLFKTAITYYNVFHQFNPTNIIVRRNKDEILESNRRNRMAALRHSTMEEAVELYEELCDRYDGFKVWTRDIINGRYDDLAAALEHAGIEFRPEIADGFIRKELWHGKT